MSAFASLQLLGILIVVLAGVAYLAGADAHIELGATVDQIGETISDFVAAGLVLVGLVRLRQGRTLEAYRWFDRSLLVDRRREVVDHVSPRDRRRPRRGERDVGRAFGRSTTGDQDGESERDAHQSSV